MNTVTVLQQLHASVKTFTFEMQKYHYTVKGRSFYILHKAFEDLYNWGFDQEDEFAERLLIIGSAPLLTIEEIIAQNQITVLAPDELENEKMLANLKASFEIFLQLAQQGLETVGDDTATDALLSDFVADVEKQLWMLKAYLA
ncbi:Dps family protein [Neisseria perflava]|uniref:Dps family protein n=1 Tax=Neisseria perflava TaxID=33053 RepID=UPI00209E789A|nr:DNA starvation/stationary phase protection protein [Neisseria perflava]MCP1661032.1 starvation-inducible DNA-binding protein [Neisseria perflava]MCP1773038.1 starvation-inducible DNA-binding protein [Neisseria perflava]